MTFSSFTHQITSKLERPDPTHSWRLFMRAFMLATIALTAWNVWIYTRVAGGETIDASAVQTPPVLDESSLNVVHTVLDNRAVEEAKYADGAYRYTDPSQ